MHVGSVDSMHIIIVIVYWVTCKHVHNSLYTTRWRRHRVAHNIMTMPPCSVLLCSSQLNFTGRFFVKNNSGVYLIIICKASLLTFIKHSLHHGNQKINIYCLPLVLVLSQCYFLRIHGVNIAKYNPVWVKNYQWRKLCTKKRTSTEGFSKTSSNWLEHFYLCERPSIKSKLKVRQRLTTPTQKREENTCRVCSHAEIATTL